MAQIPTYPPAATPMNDADAFPLWQNGRQVTASFATLLDQIEGQAIAEAVSSSAMLASGASVAAAIHNTLSATPAALPFEVSRISLGSAGSGATVSGEFALVISGGPVGHTAFVTVSAGSIVSARIGNPGIGTSNTAPTYTLPTIAGLTGATAPTATVSTIGTGRMFYAPTADGLNLGAWGNNMGALATAPFGGAQLLIPLSSVINALITSLSSVTSSGTVGPTGTLITGSNISDQCQYFLDLVPSTANSLTSIDIYDRAAGTVEVAVYRSISGTMTKQSSGTVTLTGAGAQVNKVLATPLAVQQGDVVAVRAQTASIYTFTSSIAGSGVYVGASGAFPSTITLGSMTAGVQPQVRFNFLATTQTVTATAFGALSTTVNGMSSTVSANAVAVGLLSSTTSAGSIGPTGSLITGTNISTQPQYFLDTVPAGANTLATVDVFDKAAGTVEVAVYRSVAGTLTKQSAATITCTGAGAQVTKTLSAPLSVQSGDTIGVRALSTGVYPFTSSVSGSGVYVGTAGAFPNTITLGSAQAGVGPQIRPIFTTIAQPVTAAAFTALQTTVTGQSASITDNSAVAANLKSTRTGSGTLGQTASLITGSNISTQPQYFLDVVPSGCNKLVSLDIFDKTAGQVEVAVYRSVSGTLTKLSSGTVTCTGAGAQVNKVLGTALDVLPGDTIGIRALSAGVYSFTSGVFGSGVYVSPTSGAFPSAVTLGSVTPNVTPQVRCNFNTVSQPVTTGSLAVLQSKVLARPVIDPLDYPARFTTNSGWNGFLSYGQSNSDGVNAQSALSTSQPYANLTFGSGVRAGRSGNSWGAVNTSPGTSTSKAMIEENASVGTPAADGATNSGETIITGTTSTVCELACINDGYDPSQIVWFGSAPGHTGYAIAQLQRGSAWYANLLSHVTDALALATAAGKAYKVAAVGYIQGENDASAPTSYATYKAALSQLALDFDKDIRAITGQLEPVHTLLWQIAGSNGGASLSTVADIRRAQFDAVDSAVRLLHMVGPMYPYPGQSDQIHMTPASQLRMARTTGRALDQLQRQRIKPDVLWPVMAYARGTQLRIKFRIPKAPLVLDAALLGTVTDSGFKVTDGTGTLTLSNVRVSTAGDEIVIDLNRTLGSSPVVRYALDYVSSITNLTLCAGGILRDSTTDSTVIGGTTYSMAHVCPAFQKSVTVLEAQA